MFLDVSISISALEPDVKIIKIPDIHTMEISDKD